MKKVRLIFVGMMLAIVCVGFTSCGHEADMDPVFDNVEIENVKSDEGGEGEESNGSGSTGTNDKDGI